MRITTQLINQRGVDGILEQQSQLSRLQEQIATGRRIVKPSDDPSGTTQVIRLNQVIDQTNQYQRNAGLALNRLALEETTLNSVQNSLLRVRELALQANNSTLGDSDRQAIAQEVRERLDEILGLANTRDNNGDYLFAGFQVTTKPFTKNPNGTYSYFGDQGQRFIQISAERQIADSDSGSDVFMGIKNGNGTFRIQDNVANTGTGIVSTGQVSDLSSYVADDYTITFVTNSSGNLAFNVVGATSGQLIPPLPLDATNDAPDFVSGATISFNGIQTSISGTPAVGDTFTVSPSINQDIFTTIENLAAAMEITTGSPSAEVKVINTITRSIDEIDQAFTNFLSFRTGLGARLNIIEDQQQSNDSFTIEVKKTLSQIEDVDMASAITDLQQRITALQAAQASFARIQNLTLFDFI